MKKQVQYFIFLVKLFKNIVKIIGYAVVMLSINVKMALVSFALLPLVTVLTFFFRFMSRKAYELTRNRITDLNTFLSEHLSGMKLIQIFAREEEKYAQFGAANYADASRQAVIDMREDIAQALQGRK